MRSFKLVPKAGRLPTSKLQIWPCLPAPSGPDFSHFLVTIHLKILGPVSVALEAKIPEPGRCQDFLATKKGSELGCASGMIDRSLRKRTPPHPLALGWGSPLAGPRTKKAYQIALYSFQLTEGLQWGRKKKKKSIE